MDCKESQDALEIVKRYITENRNGIKDVLEIIKGAVESRCPKCGDELYPTYLGYRLSCVSCDFYIPCGCTDYE